ncbi:MAG: hydrogenase maturation protease [Rhodospirillaceae bacterium]
MTAPGPQMVTPIVVIGVGNRFRGDDGVGPMVIRHLQGTLAEDVITEVVSGEATDLMACWDHAKAVILIDAAWGAEAPGSVIRLDLRTDAVPLAVADPSSHGLGVAEAIRMATALGTRPKEFIIFSIVGENFEHRETLSPMVAQAAWSTAINVRKDVKALRHRLYASTNA